MGVRSDDVTGTGKGLGGGTNQVGVRVYNERLILSLVRRSGALPKAEIARLTGLSAQTVSMIVKQLEQDALLLKQSPVRGRVGQPSVPFILNPEGAFSLGLKIGRRSCELVLVDLVGQVRKRAQLMYAYPTPEAVLGFIETAFVSVLAGLNTRQRQRFCGVGVAMPFELWKWEDAIGAPPEAMRRWQDIDIQAEIRHRCQCPVYLSNDATAACAAELVLGNHAHHTDFLYVFVGWFIGGGVVLGGTLYPGRSANAGALGSMPVPGAHGPTQLIRRASLCQLERAVAAHGGPVDRLWAADGDWQAFADVLGPWIDEAAPAIAHAIAAAVAVVDFPAVYIDGAFPPHVRRMLVDAVCQAYARVDQQGLSPVEILEGTVGRDARAVGGATLPILANFARDREVLFKDA